MAAFVWFTNHRMWQVVPPFTNSADVLKAYIVDPSAYVYWSTPHLFEEIKAGDAAYVFRTVDQPGVVARGTVVEPPRLLMPTNAAEFALPDRLTPPGWDELVAPSSWKTGIRIEQTFWDAPIVTGVRPQGAIGRLSEAEARSVDAEAKGR